MSEQEWIQNIGKHLVGKTIVEVAYVSEEEAEKLDWYSRPVALRLNDGTWLVPTSDDEGNDGGALTTSLKDLHIIPVL
tara:strand:+ start:175 stop:408 length:234 start_codon:yes stop_codon:yes gene_type:complete